MGLTVRVFVLLVLSACSACDAREIMTSGLSSRETVASDGSVLQINYPDSSGEGRALQVVSTNANKGVFLCEAFVSMALNYLKQSKTPLEIFDPIRKSCSHMGFLEQEVVTSLLAELVVETIKPVYDSRLLLFGSALLWWTALVLSYLWRLKRTMQPGSLCEKFNFSAHNTLMTSSLLSLDQSSLISLDQCTICHDVIAEAIVQLKIPTQRQR